MTIDIYVVTDTKDDEPCVYTDSEEAYNCIKDVLLYEGEYYKYDKEEIDTAIDELDESYNNGDFNYFGSYIGERGLGCYRKSIRL